MEKALISDCLAITQPKGLGHFPFIHSSSVIPFDQQRSTATLFKMPGEGQSVVQSEKFFEKHVFARERHVL